MKLWIRSQDKRTLVNTRRIDVDDNNIIIWDEGKYASDVFMGKYKTKERALEVLDEIQKILMPTTKLISNIDNGGHYVKTIGVEHINSYVYEMPSE